MTTQTAKTSSLDTESAKAWFIGRLPEQWTASPPEVTIDREEITVVVALDRVKLADDASEDAKHEASVGRISAWREETRSERMKIASEAQRRFGRTVSWGARMDETRTSFTHLAVPTMTRLRQPQRQVLDTLVEAGVARSRSDALKWCVQLVGQHSEQWLGELRTAMESVRTLREQGPSQP